MTKTSGIAREHSSSYVGNDYLNSRKKRIMDLLLCIPGLALFLLISPIVGLLIKLDSRGPIFYRQVRLGLDGREFAVVKFRTMVQDAESDGDALWAAEDDARITRIGRLLRNTYIDELPQWWNVLRDDMSAVGPRPERPSLFAQIADKYPDFQMRLAAKPGISGLAQVKYRYANSLSGSRSKLAYDKKYITNASLLLDFSIVVLTFIRVIRSPGT